MKSSTILKQKVRKKIRLFLQLIKFSIILPVAFLTYAGYTVYNGKADVNLFLTCLGVFLLAGAASVLNQVIELKYDSLMVRTANRPIPSGAISKKNALIIAFLMTLTGVLVLIPVSYVCILLGIFNLLWYIGVYTLLKRKTPFAVIPGSITGAIPVLIGYAGAGGSFLAPEAVFIAVFVFIWQIPHFWLLSLIYKDDYSKAGFPTLFDFFNEKQIRWWTVAWILCACIISLCTWQYGIVKSYNTAIMVLFGNIALMTLAYQYLINKPATKGFRYLFHLINFFMVLILLSISMERFG